MRSALMVSVSAGLLAAASSPAAAVTVIGATPTPGTILVYGGPKGLPSGCKYSGPATDLVPAFCENDEQDQTLVAQGAFAGGSFTAKATKSSNPTVGVSGKFNNGAEGFFVEAVATYSVNVSILDHPLEFLLGSPVTLDVVGGFTVNDPASGGSIIIGSAQYQFTGPSPGSGIAFIGGNALNVSTPDNGDTKQFDDKYSTVAGDTYKLTLDANINFTPPECCFVPGALVTATVDPTISIDPSTPNAQDFTLNFSSGFGPSSSAVPESSTWAMMLLGFAGLGIAGHRAARRTAMAKV